MKGHRHLFMIILLSHYQAVDGFDLQHPVHHPPYHIDERCRYLTSNLDHQLQSARSRSKRPVPLEDGMSVDSRGSDSLLSAVPSIPWAYIILITLASTQLPLVASATDLPVPILLETTTIHPSIDVRYFFAGAACAAISHGGTTPLDVIKTRMQLDPTLKQSGLVKTAQTILQNGGPAQFFTGFFPTLLGYGLEGALKFGLYETLKPTLFGILGTSDAAIPFLLASIAAGAAASIVLCPMEQLRIRAVADSSFSGLNILVAEEGVLGLFTGFSAMLSKQVPYTFGKQVTFDELSAWLYHIGETKLGLLDEEMHFQVSVTAAFLASIAACVLSHPGDVILTATYKSAERLSLQQTYTKISSEVGLQGFTAGLSARFVHVGAIITTQLVLYDIIKQLLGLPATGTTG